MPNKVSQANRTFSKNIQKALSTLTKSQWQCFDHPSKGETTRLNALVPTLALASNGAKLYQLSAFILTSVVSDEHSGKRTKTREYLYQIASLTPDRKGVPDGKALYEFH